VKKCMCWYLSII